MTTKANCYLGTYAANEQDARDALVQAFKGAELIKLVHKEPAQEAEESPTFVFEAYIDNPDTDNDWLHDLYTLHDLPNMPCLILY